MDWDIIFVLIMFSLTLVFAVRPFKGVGIVNLVFGLIGIIIAVSSFALSDPALPFFPWFSVLYGIVSVVCILTGSRGGGDNVLA